MLSCNQQRWGLIYRCFFGNGGDIMNYVSLDLANKSEVARAVFKMDEFRKYIPNELLESYKTLTGKDNVSFFRNLKENWNKYAPNGKDEKECKIVSFSERNTSRRYDQNYGRLMYADYALSNFKNPKMVLENISEKLYEYKANFGDRLHYLTDEQSIKQAKDLLKGFTNKIIHKQKTKGATFKP